MGMLENVYVQIALVVLAFYIVTQVIQKPRVAEHIDDAGLATAGLLSDSNSSGITATAGTGGTSGTSSSGRVQPLSALAEPILAQAPAGSGGVEEEDSSALGVAAMDYDKLFEGTGTLDPSELIPKTLPSDIFGEIKPSPALDQNFLQNSFQLGIQTQSPKRNYVHDIRGAYPNPISVVSPFLQGTIMPDFHRKVLEVSEIA
jgi:hypothetical protein